MVKDHIHQQCSEKSATAFKKHKKEAELDDRSLLIKYESENIEMFKRRNFQLTIQSKNALVINKDTVYFPFKCYVFLYQFLLQTE